METKWDDESGGWESGQGYTERPGSHTWKSCPSSLKMMKRCLWSCGCLWEPRAECLKDAPRPWLWGQGLKSQDLPPSSVPSSSALLVAGSHHSPASLSGSSMLHPLSFLALLSFTSIRLPHSQSLQLKSPQIHHSGTILSLYFFAYFHTIMNCLCLSGPLHILSLLVPELSSALNL